MRKITVATVLILALACDAVVPVAAAHTRSASGGRSLLTAALSKSIAKGFVTGQGKATLHSHQGLAIITFHGVAGTKPGLAADLKGRLTSRSGAFKVSFPYHVIVSGKRGADKVGTAMWQCFTRSTASNAATDVQRLEALIERVAANANVRNLGRVTYHGKSAIELKASAKAKVSTKLFTPRNPPNAKKIKATANVTFWLNSANHLVAGLNGTVNLKGMSGPNAVTAVDASASFSHWGEQAAITMPKICP